MITITIKEAAILSHLSRQPQKAMREKLIARPRERSEGAWQRKYAPRTPPNRRRTSARGMRSNVKQDTRHAGR